MKASDARKLSDQNKHKTGDIIKNNLFHRINESAQDGWFHLEVNALIYKKFIKELESDGYETVIENNRLIISW